MTKRDMQTEATLLDILYRAFRSEIGVEIEVSNPTLVTQRLYKIRAENEELKTLTIRPAPLNPDTHIWIVRSDASVET